MAWWLGCIINICGSISINLGTNVMKLGHNVREQSALHEADRKSITKVKEWQAGVTIFVLGNIANFLSFGFAAQSLLASLGTIQFVSNVYFARFVLHERVTPRVLLATALIVGGCIILVFFGNHQSANLHVQDMVALYGRTEYVIYLMALGGSVCVIYSLYKHGKRGSVKPKWVEPALKKLFPQRRRRPPSGPLRQDPEAPHLEDSEGSYEAEDINKRGRSSRMLPIFYAIFSAAIGSQSVLMAKTLSSLLRSALDGDPAAFTSWFTYTILVCFVVTASFWATRLNKSLQLFPAVVIVPLMQINWTLFSIVSGGMYFQEFDHFTTSQAVLFVLGVMIVISGVVLLSWSPTEPIPMDYTTMDTEMYVQNEPLSLIEEMEGEGEQSPDQSPQDLAASPITTGSREKASRSGHVTLSQPKTRISENPFTPNRGEVLNPIFAPSRQYLSPMHAIHKRPLENSKSTHMSKPGSVNGSKDGSTDMSEALESKSHVGSEGRRDDNQTMVDVSLDVNDEDEDNQQWPKPPHLRYVCGENLVSFVDDLTIDFTLSREQGFGLGLPSGGHAPVASVFGLPPTPAASSCGGDDSHYETPTSSIRGAHNSNTRLSVASNGLTPQPSNDFFDAFDADIWTAKGVEKELEVMARQHQRGKPISPARPHPSSSGSRSPAMAPPPPRKFTVPKPPSSSDSSHDALESRDYQPAGLSSPGKRLSNTLSENESIKCSVVVSPRSFTDRVGKTDASKSLFHAYESPAVNLAGGQKSNGEGWEGTKEEDQKSRREANSFGESRKNRRSASISGVKDTSSPRIGRARSLSDRDHIVNWTDAAALEEPDSAPKEMKFQHFLKSPLEKGTAVVAAAVGKAEMVLHGDASFDDSAVKRLLEHPAEELDDTSSDSFSAGITFANSLPPLANEDDLSDEANLEEVRLNREMKSDF